MPRDCQSTKQKSASRNYRRRVQNSLAALDVLYNNSTSDESCSNKQLSLVPNAESFNNCDMIGHASSKLESDVIEQGQFPLAGGDSVTSDSDVEDAFKIECEGDTLD